FGLRLLGSWFTARFLGLAPVNFTRALTGSAGDKAEPCQRDEQSKDDKRHSPHNRKVSGRLIITNKDSIRGQSAPSKIEAHSRGLMGKYSKRNHELHSTRKQAPRRDPHGVPACGSAPTNTYSFVNIRF